MRAYDLGILVSASFLYGVCVGVLLAYAFQRE